MTTETLYFRIETIDTYHDGPQIEIRELSTTQGDECWEKELTDTTGGGAFRRVPI